VTEKENNQQSEFEKGSGPTVGRSDVFNVLRRLVRPRSPLERCDLCSAGLQPDHPHLVEPGTRKLFCVCQACAILFSSKADTKYRRVPKRIRHLPDFQMSDAQWEGLMIPIGMAFFIYDTVARKIVSLYPSPGGATESLLDLDSWAEIVEANPVLREMDPDTEALLVNRVRGAAEYYLIPVDEAFKLVGIIRSNWRGLSGGSEVWEAIETFFSDLKNRSRLGEGAHA
jgi:hypothetical protein